MRSVSVSGKLTHHGCCAFLATNGDTVRVCTFHGTSSKLVFMSFVSVHRHLLLVVLGHLSLIVLVVAAAVGAELTCGDVFVVGVNALPEGNLVGELFAAHIADETSILVIWRGSMVLELKIVAKLALFFLF